MLSYTLTAQSAVVLLNNKMYTVTNDHPSFEELKAALQARDEATVERLVNVAERAAAFVGGDPEFTMDGGLVVYKGEAFAEAVSHKVLRMLEEGAEAKGLLNCLRKLYENPSRTAREEALLFFMANNFLIHEDGDVVAFKGVREDFKDVHSETFLNTVGAVHEMPRRNVDDRRDRTCSYGFHIGSLEYAKGFARGHVMIVKASPTDVVSVPSDARDRKCRVCRYEVIGELEGEWQHREVYSNKDLGLEEATVTCESCGTNVPASRSVDGAFCSNGCAVAYDDDEEEEEEFDDLDWCRQPPEEHVVMCAFCGHRIGAEAPRWAGIDEQRENMYCSTQCRGADVHRQSNQ